MWSALHHQNKVSSTVPWHSPEGQRSTFVQSLILCSAHFAAFLFTLLVARHGVVFSVRLVGSEASWCCPYSLPVLCWLPWNTIWWLVWMYGDLPCRCGQLTPTHRYQLSDPPPQRASAWGEVDHHVLLLHHLPWWFVNCDRKCNEIRELFSTLSKSFVADGYDE